MHRAPVISINTNDCEYVKISLVMSYYPCTFIIDISRRGHDASCPYTYNAAMGDISLYGEGTHLIHILNSSYLSQITG